MKSPIYFVSYVYGSLYAQRPADVKNILLEGQSPLDWLAAHIEKGAPSPDGSQLAPVRILFWADISTMPVKPDALLTLVKRLGVVSV